MCHKAIIQSINYAIWRIDGVWTRSAPLRMSCKLTVDGADWSSIQVYITDNNNSLGNIDCQMLDKVDKVIREDRCGHLWSWFVHDYQHEVHRRALYLDSHLLYGRKRWQRETMNGVPCFVKQAHPSMASLSVQNVSSQSVPSLFNVVMATRCTGDETGAFCGLESHLNSGDKTKTTRRDAVRYHWIFVADGTTV